MSFLASTPLGDVVFSVPERLLRLVPAAVEPLTSLTHAATTAYWPMIVRALVQASLEPRVGYDNVDPRQQVARLLGKSRLFDRLQASHLNLLESLPLFCSAVLAGVVAGVDATRLSKLATLWLVLRNAYVGVYLVNNKYTSVIRSLLYLWSLAISCNLLREAARKFRSKPKED